MRPLRLRCKLNVWRRFTTFLATILRYLATSRHFWRKMNVLEILSPESVRPIGGDTGEYCRTIGDIVNFTQAPIQI